MAHVTSCLLKGLFWIIGKQGRLRAMRGGLHLEVLAGKAVGFKFTSFYMVAGHLHLLVDVFLLGRVQNTRLVSCLQCTDAVPLCDLILDLMQPLLQCMF